MPRAQQTAAAACLAIEAVAAAAGQLMDRPEHEPRRQPSSELGAAAAIEQACGLHADELRRRRAPVGPHRRLTNEYFLWRPRCVRLLLVFLYRLYVDVMYVRSCMRVMI